MVLISLWFRGDFLGPKKHWSGFDFIVLIVLAVVVFVFALTPIGFIVGVVALIVFLNERNKRR